MKIGIIALVPFLLIAALGAGYWGASLQSRTLQKPMNEDAFDRVMKTNTLRCGYYVYPPATRKDPNTSQLSGLFVDMMDHIAQKTGLKVEWTEEVTFANWVPGLQNRRFDALCTPTWPDMALGREAIFGQPVFFSTLLPVVRGDDQRFIGRDLEQFNHDDVTLAVQEATPSYFIAREAFPQAKLLVVPANVDGPTLALNLVTGKAQVMLWDRNGYLQFNKNNPGALRPVETNLPVKIMPFSFAVGKGQLALNIFLNNAVGDMLATGTMDRLISKWEPAPRVFERVALPYRQ